MDFRAVCQTGNSREACCLTPPFGQRLKSRSAKRRYGLAMKSTSAISSFNVNVLDFSAKV